MSKVIFEFDEDEDRNDIRYIIDRHKLISALYNLQNLKHDLYKSYIPENVKCVLKEEKVTYNNDLGEQVTDTMPIKIITEADIEKARISGQLYVEGSMLYIKSSYIEDELDNILDSVKHLLD